MELGCQCYNVIQRGGNFVTNTIRAEDIIYVAISLKSFLEDKQLYYFTNGHATNNLTSFYDSTKISELPKLIDWKAVSSKYWSEEMEIDLRRRKQAEFLIKGDVSNRHIKGFVCYNEMPSKNYWI